jgi:hypothetical protein
MTKKTNGQDEKRNKSWEEETGWKGDDFNETSEGQSADVWGDALDPLAQEFDFNASPGVNDEMQKVTDASDVIDDEPSSLTDSRSTKLKPVISPSVLCTAIGVANFIQGGILGGVIGTFHASIDGFSNGYSRQPGFGRFLFSSGVSSAASFGGWLGAYTSVKCYMKSTRAKDDFLNSFGGGFAAGMVGTLRSRNPRIMIISGLGSGVLMSILDSIQGHSSQPSKS